MNPLSSQPANLQRYKPSDCPTDRQIDALHGWLDSLLDSWLVHGSPRHLHIWVYIWKQWSKPKLEYMYRYISTFESMQTYLLQKWAILPYRHCTPPQDRLWKNWRHWQRWLKTSAKNGTRQTSWFWGIWMLTVPMCPRRPGQAFPFVRTPSSGGSLLMMWIPQSATIPTVLMTGACMCAASVQTAVLSLLVCFVGMCL